MENRRPPLAVTRDAQIFEEPLIFERSRPGRIGSSLPADHASLPLDLPSEMLREAELPLPEVSEPEVVRHFTRLSTWNYGIDLNLYPLGSCTMKYNPRINEEMASLPHIRDAHPSMPEAFIQTQLRLIYELQQKLCIITDMPGITLQPAAGAHGELTGIFLIRAYHRSRGNARNVIIVPDSAHGTNPATCALAGYEVRELKSGPDGMLDLEALKAALDHNVAALMITNPNTLGVFESQIKEASDLLHAIDALLYMDGANFNAIVGKASPGRMGVDVCHLNLHKTFSTPHGGGGPGAAAVVVSDKLVDFLPGPVVAKEGERFFWSFPEKSIGRMKSGPGHFGVLVRALTYILSYGNELKRVAEHATLNANIVREELKDVLRIASSGDSMHEAVFSDSSFKKSGFDTMTLAKALIDYGYHPPTVYFPLIVPGSIMIEPTETESPETIRHFAAVVKDIVRRMNEGDESLRSLPQRSPVTRVDEVTAARNPVLNYFTNQKASE
jgi:glycine dehydrogenase subunit 2